MVAWRDMNLTGASGSPLASRPARPVDALLEKLEPALLLLEQRIHTRLLLAVNFEALVHAAARATSAAAGPHTAGSRPINRPSATSIRHRRLQEGFMRARASV